MWHYFSAIKETVAWDIFLPFRHRQDDDIRILNYVMTPRDYNNFFIQIYSFLHTRAEHCADIDLITKTVFHF